jgi:DNA-binding transcriptional LysR family regulator
MHPNVNLSYLKFFRDAAENKSLSKSAKSNFVTQSAITQGIQKLEKSLGVELTTHQKHVFKLTHEGQIVLEWAQQILRNLKEMQEELHETKNSTCGPIHFLCPQSIAMTFIPGSMDRLKKNYPETTLHFQIANTELIHASLKQGNCDFGIVLDSKDFNMYEKKILYSGNFRVYNKNAKLEEGVLVDHEEGLNVDLLKSMFRKHFKKDLIIKGELVSWEVIARFVEENQICGFFPDYLLKNGRYPSITSWHKKIPSIPYEVVAIYPKGSKLSKAANAFLEIF